MKILELQTYIDALSDKGILKSFNIDAAKLHSLIECVSYDTRKLKGNSIFICKGAHFKNDYAKDALHKGSVCYVAEQKIDDLDSYVEVTNIREAIVVCAQLFFDNAPQKIKTVGITGTKGKGCVAYFLREILDEYLESQNKKKCAFLSTSETYDGINSFESHLTTPETLELYEHFDNAYQSGIEYLIMEVSSLAIKFGRTKGLSYEAACFTNFGRDHISDIEHPNMDDYFASKLKIFDNSKFACFNLDDLKSSEIINYIKDKSKILSFGQNVRADLCASNVDANGENISFKLDTPNYSSQIELKTSGIFNVSNALAAASLATCLHVPEKFIVNGLKNTVIPGRMKTYVSKDKKLVIVVDYAHNKMSFEAVFNSLKKEYPDASIGAVFGSVGGKAYERRKDLPETASKYCSYIVICEDETNFDKFDDIANEITSFITIDNFSVIESREQAIKHIVENWDIKGQKVIAFLGKGEEATIKRNGKFIPCMSDMDLANQCIEIYNMSH